VNPEAVSDTVNTSVLQSGTSNGPWRLYLLRWDLAVSSKVPTVAETVTKAFTMSLCHLDFLKNALKGHYKVSSFYQGTSFMNCRGLTSSVKFS